jgi:ribonuclease R
MKQANYDILNVGHFGLASTGYLHFTSPIRRYPDLVVHRVTRAMLHHEPTDRSPEAEDRLRLAASTASDCERRGMDVEREIVDLYRALYMRSYIGSVYQGTVTSVVGSGLFVNLDKPFVDVLVRLESIGRDVYELDESGLSITGVRSGERIKIGDSMLVQIEDVAILRRSIYGRRVVAADEEVVVAEEVGPRLAKHAQTRRVRKTKATQETKPEKRVKASKTGKTTKPAKTKKAPKAKAKPKTKKTRR